MGISPPSPRPASLSWSCAFVVNLPPTITHSGTFLPIANHMVTPTFHYRQPLLLLIITLVCLFGYYKQSNKMRYPLSPQNGEGGRVSSLRSAWEGNKSPVNKSRRTVLPSEVRSKEKSRAKQSWRSAGQENTSSVPAWRATPDKRSPVKSQGWKSSSSSPYTKREVSTSLSPGPRLNSPGRIASPGSASKAFLQRPMTTFANGKLLDRRNRMCLHMMCIEPVKRRPSAQVARVLFLRLKSIEVKMNKIHLLL